MARSLQVNFLTSTLRRAKTVKSYPVVNVIATNNLKAFLSGSKKTLCRKKTTWPTCSGQAGLFYSGMLYFVSFTMLLN